MRTENKLSLVAILALFFMVSCSKSDIPPTQTEENKKAEETPKKDENNGKDNTSALNENKQFVYKALVEDATGTWCHNCPRVSIAIENAKKSEKYKARFIPLAIHSNGGLRVYEPMHLPKNVKIIRYFKTLPGKLKFDGYPHFMLNRKEVLSTSNAHVSIFTHLDNTPTSPIGIKISSNLTETRGSVSVSFKSKAKIDNLKYHIFVLENKIIASQYDGGGYIQDYNHNDVVRDFYGNADGNDLGSFLESNSEITKSNLEFTYTLLSNDKLKNVKIVVFVTNQSGQVLNAQVAKANEEKDYQYAE